MSYEEVTSTPTRAICLWWQLNTHLHLGNQTITGRYLIIVVK